ncbi:MULTISPECIES: RNA polymerase sigma factor [Nocardioides]|uniref:RNA polymerase sigma factor n=1 Tax=Nocardioides vastitatis TaxID=2568655 RepID=A0ABW0ZBU6_9ACTN|nr:sigma-70 family RNA polymerase sigma factor [Nocardioides sp.]THI94728.1 sigma-70 family RNA polymerase sigma factor [Nocardioides sp.]
MNDVPDDPIQRCFHASYRRLVGQLYGVCGDLTEAEEVVAEAFARAVASRRTFERLDQPEAWLRAVAVNVARTRHKRRVVGERLVGRSTPRAEAEVRHPDLTEDRLALVDALRSLPQAQRETLALHYLADLPVAEVAATLGVAPGTVKARLSRGRAALAAVLGVADGESDQLVNGGSRG